MGDQRLNGWTGKSRANLKLKDPVVACREVLCVAFKQESRDDTSMFVRAVFAQIRRRLPDDSINRQPPAGHVRAVKSPSSPLKLDEVINAGV